MSTKKFTFVQNLNRNNDPNVPTLKQISPESSSYVMVTNCKYKKETQYKNQIQKLESSKIIGTNLIKKKIYL